METGQASRTALGVARRRAAHQLLDHPQVLVDPIAVRILGPAFQLDAKAQEERVARAFRAFMAVRSRYVEDHLAEAVDAGVAQYVVLGAGLDTFAYRNPYPQLHVFEADFPATQQWKRGLLRTAVIPEPDNLTFVPLDFDHRTSRDGLVEAGFDLLQPAYFGWLGVVPYLTLAAFRSTLDFVAGLPPGSGISFDYALSDKELSPRLQMVRKVLAARVAAAGEPFRLFFTTEQIENELKSAGFDRIEQADSVELNERYFSGRADGLALPEEGLGKLATASVG